MLVTGCDAGRAERLGRALVEAVRAVRVPSATRCSTRRRASAIVALGGAAGEPEELLVEADLAMDEAKAAGGDRAVVHDPSRGARERASTDMRMSQRLRAALERDALVLHAQPIVDAATGEPLLYELLVRLRDECGRDHAAGRVPAARGALRVHRGDRPLGRRRAPWSTSASTA